MTASCRTRRRRRRQQQQQQSPLLVNAILSSSSVLSLSITTFCFFFLLNSSTRNTTALVSAFVTQHQRNNNNNINIHNIHFQHHHHRRHRQKYCQRTTTTIAQSTNTELCLSVTTPTTTSPSRQIPTPEDVEIEYTYPRDFLDDEGQRKQWDEVVERDQYFRVLLEDPASYTDDEEEVTALPELEETFAGCTYVVDVIFRGGGRNRRMHRLRKRAFRTCVNVQRIEHLEEEDDDEKDDDEDDEKKVRTPLQSVESLLKWYNYRERIVKLYFRAHDGVLIGEESVMNKSTINDGSCYLVPATFYDTTTSTTNTNTKNNESHDNDNDSTDTSNNNKKNSDGTSTGGTGTPPCTTPGILAEVQDGGITKICRIIGIKLLEKKSSNKKNKKTTSNTNNSSSKLNPPRLIVQFVNVVDGTITATANTKQVIDIGQITTVWKLTRSLMKEDQEDVFDHNNRSRTKGGMSVIKNKKELPQNVKDIINKREKKTTTATINKTSTPTPTSAPSTLSSSDGEDNDEQVQQLNLLRKVQQNLPIDQVEHILERKYTFHNGRGKNIHVEETKNQFDTDKNKTDLTKKQLNMLRDASILIANNNDSDDGDDTTAAKSSTNEEFQNIVNQLLKQCLKCGSKYSRILDSYIVEQDMFYDYEGAMGRIVNDYTGNNNHIKSESMMGGKFNKNKSKRKHLEDRLETVAQTSLYERLRFCASVLSDDTQLLTGSGRFKRMPSMWIPPMPNASTFEDNDDDEGTNSSSSGNTSSPGSSTAVQVVTFVNGGYITVDKSVRAAKEGRQFAAKALANGGRFDCGTNDERILCRLESLACGEKLKQQQQNQRYQKNNNSNTNNNNSGQFKLEVDVRATLQTMDLPLTSEGAQQALIRMGRWTEIDDDDKNSNQADRKKSGNIIYERWSPLVLEASEWYITMDKLRRQDLKSNVLSKRKREQEPQQVLQRQEQSNNKRLSQYNNKIPSIEKRIDLTMVPSICIDAVRTDFRDDAFGIRTRASTGRSVHESSGSRFEILIHITDVSDLYAKEPMLAETTVPIEEQVKYLQELEQTASSRIRSQYDFPLGPLHLLPPQVLRSLSLQVFKQDFQSDPKTWPNSWHGLSDDDEASTINRCVTIWVYIDETNGSIIDMGMERTIISRPLALSFSHASKLLELDSNQQQLPPLLSNAKSVLTAVENTLLIWEKARLKESESLRSRKEKIEAKHFLSEQVNRGNSNNNYRKGNAQAQDGNFKFSRGHQMVDLILVLYENAFQMMRYKKGNGYTLVPIHSAGHYKDAGTLRTASNPLRTYVHGLAQQQGLALLCGYGGPIMSNDECKEIGRRISKSFNLKRYQGGATKGGKTVSWRQMKAVKSLKIHLRQHEKKYQQTPLPAIPAISTGKNSEVLIQGVGAVALCKNIPGTLKTGVKVMVDIVEVDEQNGKVVVALHQNNE